MISKLVIGSVVAAISFASAASPQIWNFDQHIANEDYGNSLTYNQGGVSLTVSAWASTGDGCGTINMTRNDGDYRTAQDVDSCIENARLSQNGSGNNYSGLGVINRDEYFDERYAPDHALDSANEAEDKGYNNYDFDGEMVLLSFSESVSISSLNAGWRWGDSDSSVLAFDETSGASTDFFNGHTNWADIVGNGQNGGWDLVQASESFQGNSLAVSPTKYSKYWLVGAFNSVFGGTPDTGDDAFKFAGVTTVIKPDTGTGVIDASAPATGILLAVFGGLLLLRRKSY